MGDDVPDRETAIELAKEYAESECVGQIGDSIDVEERDMTWIVKFQMYTYSEKTTHRVKITKSVGNVISHDRSSRFE
jgi:hypothetical protein